MSHYLSLCAIFQNEAPFLEEWLRFHDRIGVEHFFLYDNDSTDEFKPVLAPWLAAGRVTLYRAAGPAAQIHVYHHCIGAHARDSFWMIFTDIDEYLFSPAQADLRVFLKGFESEPGVVANWLMFGSSGHERQPAGLTTLNFARRCEFDLCTFEPGLLKDKNLDPKNPASYFKFCGHVKSIVNMRDIVDVGLNVHVFRYRDGRPSVNANHRPLSGYFSEDESAIGLLRIHHYASRSWEEYRRRLQRVRADTGAPYEAERLLKRNLLFNQIEDKTIFPLAREIESDMRAQKPPRPG
ncbi:MAG: glycosyltransferase family 2 protein [Tepidisphaeraceae bacterium]|jgi:hypothetical protein